MASPTLLIASSSVDEAITQCVLENKEKFSLEIELILLDEIMEDVDIYDELSDNASIIRWFKPDTTMISNTSHVLLNRVLYVDDDLFSKFIVSDRDYAKREFEAYLGYSFNSFDGVGNKTVNGICESILSLPQQWNEITIHTGFQVPYYYWGPTHACNLNKTRELVFSNIYDYLNWSTLKPKNDDYHTFCFEKPTGVPVFSLSIGEQTLITLEDEISSLAEEKIKLITKRVRELWGYFIFEALYFVDKKEGVVTFGCVNLNIVRSDRNPLFCQFVCNHLTEEYLKCFN